METRCQKCGAAVGAEQAFCQKCGAVVGMSAAADPQREEGWDLAATMTGRQRPQPASRTRPSAERPSHAPASAAAAAAATGPAPRRGNAVLLAVVGFVAVLALGGLVILLLYLN